MLQIELLISDGYTNRLDGDNLTASTASGGLNKSRKLLRAVRLSSCLLVYPWHDTTVGYAEQVSGY